MSGREDGPAVAHGAGGGDRPTGPSRGRRGGLLGCAAAVLLLCAALIGAAPPAQAQTTVWEATVTAGEGTGADGYGYIATAHPWASDYGSITDDDFDLDGTSYTVWRVSMATEVVSGVYFAVATGATPALAQLPTELASELTLEITANEGHSDGADVLTLPLSDATYTDAETSSFWAGYRWPSVTDSDIQPSIGKDDTFTVKLIRSGGTSTNTPATGAPAITGTPQDGQTLTAGIGTMADANGLPATFPDDYAFQWIRVDGSDETDIPGATSSTYMPVAADVGKTLKVRVSFQDDAGNDEALTSAATAAVFGCTVPELTGRDVHWTATLTAAANPNNVTEVGFEGGVRGTLSPADFSIGTTDYRVTDLIHQGPANIFFRLASANAGLTAEQVAVATLHICDTELAFSSAGEVNVRTYIWGSVTGGPLFSAGNQVTVRLSTPTTGAPAVTGTPLFGETLTAGQGTIADADGLPTTFPDDYAFQWIRVDGSDETDIPGATSQTYEPVAADAGKTLKVRVSYTDDAGNAESRTSAPTAAVGGTPVTPTPPTPNAVWSADVTAGNHNTGEQVGYVAPAHPLSYSIGSITDDGFDLEGTTYTVWRVAANTSDTGTFHFTVATGDTPAAAPLPSTLLDELSLKVTANESHSDGPDVSTWPLSEATYDDGTTDSALTGYRWSGWSTGDNLIEPHVGSGSIFKVELLRTSTTSICAAASLGGRRLVKSFRLTVGSGTLDARTFHGYSTRTTPVTGAADDDSFLIRDRESLPNYAYELYTESAPTAGQLSVSLNSDLLTEQRNALRLHVCGDSTGLAFSAATRTTSTVDLFGRTLTNYHYRWPSADLDWSGATTRTVHLSLPANNPATGDPTIAATGTGMLGDELTANTGAITDADGLPDTFEYQWIRENGDGTNPEDIAGATSSTYRLTFDDFGKKVRVRVAFEDLLGGDETRTSAAFPAAGTVTGDPALLGVDVTSTPLQNPDSLAEPDTYGAREHIEFTARFNTPVVVASGVPTFTFVIGTTDAVAHYYRGSGTDTLVFSYAVRGGGAGDEDTDGITWEANQLAGAIRVEGTSDAPALTHDAQSTALAGHKVDGRDTTNRYATATVTDITVISVPKLTEQGTTLLNTYGAGEDIEIRVTFSQPVAVAGDPKFRFEMGDSGETAADVDADYDPGQSTSTRLVFVYTVQAGDSDDNDIAIGQYSSANPDTFQLEDDDRIRVAANNVDADLGHARQGNQTGHRVAGSRSANSPATGTPAVTGTPQAGQTLTAGIGTIADADGLPATFPDDYAFQWIRVDGSIETDIPGAASSTYVPVAADVGTTLRVRVSFEDRAGFDEARTSAATAAVTAAPGACAAPDLAGRRHLWTGTVTVGTYESGGVVLSHGFVDGTATGPGIGQIGALDDTGFDIGANGYTIDWAVAYEIGTLGGHLVFSLTSDLAAAEKAALQLHVCDTAYAFDDATLTGGSTYDWDPGSSPDFDWSTLSTVTLHLSLPPTLLDVDVTSTPLQDPDNTGTPDTYGAREHIEFTARFNAPVVVASGVPTFTFDLGGTDAVAHYFAGSGTDTLVFSYAVRGGNAGDQDADGISWAADQLMGAIHVEGTTDAPALTHEARSALAGHKVDGRDTSNQAATATVTDIEVTSEPKQDPADTGTPDTYGQGEDIEITVTFSLAVAVEGDPKFRFSMTSPGGPANNVDAVYDAALSTSTEVVFVYTVQAGDMDDNGIWIGQYASSNRDTFQLEDDDRIRVAANNVDADLGHAQEGTKPGHKVDGSANAAPRVALAVLDQVAAAGALFRFQIPNGAFVDPDGEGLTLMATLSDDSDLPAWLTFTAGTRTFSGTPGTGDIGTITVRVTASDPSDVSVYDEFDIRVKPPGTACPAPGLGGRRPVHSFEFTVGSGTLGTRTIDGYAQTNPPIGGVIDSNAFDIGSAELVFTDIYTESAPTAGQLTFALFDRDLETVQRDALRLHVCGDSTGLAFSAATRTTTTDDSLGFTETWFHYRWPSANLDWSGEITRTVHLSLPANRPATGAPTVSGTAEVGETLTAETGAVADADGLPDTLEYQWVREDMDGTNAQDIEGETSSTYTLAVADLGKRVRVRVAFEDLLGGEETLVSAAFPATDAVSAPGTAACMAPEFGTRRYVWSGAVTVAESIDTGTFGYSDDEPFGSINSMSFTIGANSHTVKIVQVATGTGDLTFTVKDGGVLPAAAQLHVCDSALDIDDATLVSNVGGFHSYTWDLDLDWSTLSTVTVHLSLPANSAATGAPTVSGTAEVGETLTAATSGIMDEDGLPAAFDYQWVRENEDGTNLEVIAGATSDTYTLTAADFRKRVRVRVEFIDLLGGEEALESAAFPTTGAVTATPALLDVDVTSTPLQNPDSLAEPDTYGAREHIEFTARFNTPVVVASGVPTFTFVIGTTDAVAHYYRGSGTDELVFSYAVRGGNAGDEDTDGITWEASKLAGTIHVEGATDVPALTHDAQSTALAGHKVDGKDSDNRAETATVSSVAVTSTPLLDPDDTGTPDTYGATEVIEIAATFSEAVTVHGDPKFRFQMGDAGETAADVDAVYDAGRSSPTRLVFVYTVQATDSDDDGISIGEYSSSNRDTFQLESDDRIRVAATNVDAALGHGEEGTQTAHKVDGSMTAGPTAPADPANVSLESATGRTLTVTWEHPDDGGSELTASYLHYREQDAGADWSNWFLSEPATRAMITGLTPGTLYEVRVSVANAEGSSAWVTARGFSTQAGTACAEPEFGDRRHIWTGTVTVGEDRHPDAPVFYGYFRGGGGVGALDDTTFSIGANNYVISVIRVQSGGSDDGDLGFRLFGDGFTDVEVAALRLDVCNTPYDFSDAAANSDRFSFQWNAGLDWEAETERTLHLSLPPEPDTTAPELVSIEREAPAVSPTNADTLTWRVTFSEPVADVDAADFEVTGAGTVTLTVTAEDPPDAVLVEASGGELAGLDGTVTLTLAAGQDIVDLHPPPVALANTEPTGANDNSYVVDNSGPALLSAVVEGTTLTLLYDEALDAGSVPAAGDYSVSVDGTAAAPTAVALTGSRVELTLGAAPAEDAAVTVTYTVPATNPVRDGVGNEAAALAAQTVTRSLIRLAGGAGENEGRVEVFHAGQWGTVCDDYWDNKDADVACRMAGYDAGSVEDAGQFRRAHFGEGSLSKIWLDNLQCTGDEESLFECRRARSLAVGEHNCKPRENVGVRCLVTGETAPPRVQETNGIELNAAPGGSWSAGETVEVTLVWSEAVTVATPAGGEPPKLWIGFSDDEHLDKSGVVRRAVYARGSGTDSTVFTYTLKAGYAPFDSTGAGGDSWRPGLAPAYEKVQVYRNSLRLRDGTIRSEGGVDAELAHPGHPLAAPQLEAPRVVAAEPAVSGPGPDGLWTPGETVEVGLAFDRQVFVAVSGGTPSLEIGFLNGQKRRAPYSRGTGTHELIFAYTLAEADEAQNAILVTPDSLALGGGRIRGLPDGADAALGHEGAAVLAPPVQDPPPVSFTGSFSGVAAEHDGETSFVLGFAFSEAPAEPFSFRTVRNSLFAVSGGSIEWARRKVRGESVSWTLTVRPGGDADVTLTMRTSGSCEASPRVCTADARPLSGQASATVPGPAALSVADAEAQEGPGAALDFVVTLSRARSEATTVAYATADVTATAGEDYRETSGTLAFAAGVTERTVSVAVLDDAHDEGTETLTLTLSEPSPASYVRIADGTATGTIGNDDPMPQAWIARFGRTVAEQVLEAVEGRMRAARAAGAELSLAGQRIGLGPVFGGAGEPSASEDRAAAEAEDEGRRLADWLADGSDEGGAQRRLVSGRELLTGSAFALTAAPGGSGGTMALWGRGAVSRFDGRAGDLAVDGEVVSGLLGGDWSPGSGTATLGLIVGHSRGEGGWRSASGGGTVVSTLTGVYPWVRRALTERLEVWGAAGYGEGTLTLTPEAGTAARAGLDLMMGAAGVRGVVLAAPAGGPEVAVTADAMGVAVTTARAPDLAAAEADVTRLRLGLEGSWPVRLERGASLTPSLALGVRHDGGDAETGYGADVGGGIAWSDPGRGLMAEVRGRGLLSHEASGLRERGLSGALSWEPDAGGRGPRLSLTQTLGGASEGGIETLHGRRTLAGLAADGDGDELRRRRLEARLGYGFSAFGDGFTLTPEAGAGLSDAGRDYTLSWRLSRRGGGDAGSLELALEARRQESANDNGPPRHEFGLRVNIRW